MIVVFVDQTAQLGGAELCLLDLVSGLAEGGGKAQVILFEDGPFVLKLERAGVPALVHPLPGSMRKTKKRGGGVIVRRPWLLLNAGIRAVGWCAQFRGLISAADLLYLNTAKAIVLGTVSTMFSCTRRVVHLHDILDRAHFGRFNLAVLRWAVRRADAVICNSEATREAYLDGQTPGRGQILAVVPNGFPVLGGGEPPRGEGAASGRECRQADFTIGVFGRLAEWKGQHVAIEALRNVPDCRLVIVGEALFSEEDRAYARKLKQKVKEYQLESRVEFLGQRNDVAALMSQVDAVLHTSIAPEPFGRVIVEGMLAGKPVVAARAGGPMEIIEEGQTGLLYEPGSSPQLAQAISKLQADRELCREMGKKAREVAVDRYEIGKVVDRIEGILRETLRCKRVAQTHRGSSRAVRAPGGEEEGVLGSRCRSRRNGA